MMPGIPLKVCPDKIQTRHHQNTSQFEDLFIPRLSTIALLRQQQVWMGSQKADRIDDVWWGGEWKLLVQYTSDTEIYSPTCPMNIYLLIWSSIPRWLNPANTFFKGKWKWELKSHSLVTGDQCQLLTEGHSRRILGVKVRCTYSEADYPLMQAGRLSRTYECTLKSKSGMSVETRRLGVPPVFASVPFNVPYSG